MNAKVEVKCVDCDATKTVEPGEIGADEMPMCECGSVMIPIGAVVDD